MELIINKNIQLKTIQEDFQKHYPYLKIEFYKTAHKESKGSPAKNLLDIYLTIAQVQKTTKEGLLHIRGTMKVSEVENDFAEQFGLQAQVFRKSGDVWLQTTQTDNWTLTEQNRVAMEMNEKDVAATPEDYHEQE